MFSFTKRPPDKEGAAMQNVLQTQLAFAGKTAMAIAHDLLNLLGFRKLLSLAETPEKLLRRLQSAYMQKEQRATELRWLYKENQQHWAENRNGFCDAITLIDPKTQTPIHKDDQAPKLIPLPEFKEAPASQLIELRQGAVSNDVIDKEVNQIPEGSPKVIGKIIGTVNRLGVVHTKALTDQFRFTAFNKLPEVSNLKQRSLPIRQNVIASLMGNYGHAIVFLYLLGLLGESVVFVTLGTTVMGLDLIKAILFAGILVGVSYILALLVHDALKSFLRSRAWVPWVYWVFLSVTLIVVLSAGFLNYTGLQEKRQQANYITELQNLESLQMAAFVSPNDTSINDELTFQQERINSLDEGMTGENSMKNIASLMLFMTLGLMSLLTSSMLLAFKVILARVRKLNSMQIKAQKAITSIESEYNHLLSVLIKGRELITVYCFELGRYMALKTLLGYPPALADLSTSSRTAVSTSQKSTSKTSKSKKPTGSSEPKAAGVTELLNTENYEQLYDEN